MQHCSLVKFQTFAGNTDQKGLRSHAINPPVHACYVRVDPRGWHSGISMRMELYGCVHGLYIISPL